jgi:hypothetical protein
MWLCCTRLVPIPVGWGSCHSTRSWSQEGGLVIPCVAEAQQGLKGSGLWGGGCYPGLLWDQFWAGVWHGPVVGILVVDLAVWPRGRYSGMVWVCRLEASVAEGRISRRVWVWLRAVAWHSLRGGEPGRTEQQLCRPTG